ncbi:MAG: hypothetical protein WCO93_01940 [bacterium]
MKNSTIPAFIFLSFALLFVGCGTDPSPSPGDARSQFLGQWRVTESTKNLTYDVNITADVNSSDGVLIYNFGSFGSSVSAGALISGNRITLDPNQEIVSGVIINGAGTLSGSSINWTYTINDGADLITVTAEFRRP